MIIPFQGMAPRVGARVFVAPNATVLGDVRIGDDASVWFNCVLRGDVHAITVGDQPVVEFLKAFDGQGGPAARAPCR